MGRARLTRLHGLMVYTFTCTNTSALAGRRLTTGTATAWTIGARIFVELKDLYLIRLALPPSPTSRNRECDVACSLRCQLQIALVLLRVARNGLDDALHLDLTRNGLLARVTDHSVAERFANVEKEFVAFLLRVLDVFSSRISFGVESITSGQLSSTARSSVSSSV